MLAATALVGAIMLSALLTDGNPDAKLRAVTTALGVFLFFVLAVNVLETERDVHRLFWTLAICNTISAVISLNYGGYRLKGAMHLDAPGIGLNAFMGLCMVPYLFMTAGKKWIKVALVAMAAILILTVFRSQARVAMINFGLCSVYAILRWRSSLRLSTVLLFSALALALVWPLLPQLADRLHAVSADGSMDLRFKTIMAGFDMFTESPIWGVGPGQFTSRFASEDYRYVLEYRGWSLLNAYVCVLAEDGILGLAAFAALFVFSFRDLWTATRHYEPKNDDSRGAIAPAPGMKSDTGWRLKRQAATVEIALLGMAQAALSQPSQYDKYLWLTFALAAVIHRLSPRSQETRQTALPEAR
jgi:O-antigen ligase